MKLNKYIVVALLLVLSITSFVNSQENKPRPSTLQKILIESDNFPKKDIVIKAYQSIPFPSQYVDFNFNSVSFNPKKYKITNEDRAAAGKSQSKLGGMSKAALGNATGGLIDSVAADLPLQIEKYLKDNQIAKKIGAKWLDIQNGRAQLGNYMTERSLSGLSEAERKKIDMDLHLANVLVQDVDIMEKSFVIFNKLFFQENEPVVRIARDLAILQAQKITVPALQQKAIEAANFAYEKAKEGYTVFATSYLYKLDWNSQKAALANDYFNNKNVDAKIAFDTTSLFQMKFIGKETSTAIVTFSLKVKRTEEQIIALAVKRAVSNSMSTLQRKNEVFRPIYLLKDLNPVTAEIGLKEGLLPGDKFELLSIEKGKTGSIVYKKAGKLKVDKKTLIWDNIDNEVKLDSLGNQIVLPTFTPFKGKNKKERRYIRLAS